MLVGGEFVTTVGVAAEATDASMINAIMPMHVFLIILVPLSTQAEGVEMKRNLQVPAA